MRRIRENVGLVSGASFQQRTIMSTMSSLSSLSSTFSRGRYEGTSPLRMRLITSARRQRRIRKAKCVYHRHNQQYEKNEVIMGTAYYKPPERPTDGHDVSPLGYNTTRKYDMGDQSSGGETAWRNTGGTRSGRGLRTTG